MECCIMNLFCLNGYNGEKIRLDLNEVIGFPITQASKVAMTSYAH